jgi:hypothetical protein
MDLHSLKDLEDVTEIDLKMAKEVEDQEEKLGILHPEED